MPLEILTAPDPLLIPLETAAERLGLGVSDEDALAPILAAACQSITSFVGRPLGLGEYRETLRLAHPVADLPLSRWPVVSIASIIEGSETLAATDFEAEPDTGLVRRLTAKGRYQCWPADVVVVEYTAGFAAIPSDIESAVLALVSDAWAKRDRDPWLKSIAIGSISLGYLDPNARAALSVVEPLLAPYRCPAVG